MKTIRWGQRELSFSRKATVIAVAAVAAAACKPGRNREGIIDLKLDSSPPGDPPLKPKILHKNRRFSDIKKRDENPIHVFKLWVRATFFKILHRNSARGGEKMSKTWNCPRDRTGGYRNK